MAFLPLCQPSLPIHIAPPLSLTALALALALLCPPSSLCPVCQQCPHHLNPNPAVSQAQCHPVLYPTSPEDPPPPPPPQLPAGSAESLVHSSTRPALDSLPGPVWTPYPSPDYLSSLTVFYLWYFTEIVTKLPSLKKVF